MKIEKFKQLSIKQDKRNRFEQLQKCESFIPKEISAFYIKMNPVDVEVTINQNQISFYSNENLAELQNQYKLGKDFFVFATCNSDPIYLHKGKVYTMCHEAKNAKAELLASNFFDFLGQIDA